MIIHSYETSKRCDACIGYLETSRITENTEKIILLPIPSTKDNSTVLNTNIYINDVLELIEPKTVVCGYGLPAGFLDAAEKMGALVLDLGRNEDFLLENAHITSLCALSVILATAGAIPSELNIGVVGYGRIGKKLTELFTYLGSSVRVYTTRQSVRYELGECGISSVLGTAAGDLSELDILINTAPAKLFSASDIPIGLRIIELASGDNFPGVPNVEKYPSVPAKIFPASAGKTWGKAIERFILNNQ